MREGVAIGVEALEQWSELTQGVLRLRGVGRVAREAGDERLDAGGRVAPERFVVQLAELLGREVVDPVDEDPELPHGFAGMGRDGVARGLHALHVPGARPLQGRGHALHIFPRCHVTTISPAGRAAYDGRHALPVTTIGLMDGRIAQLLQTTPIFRKLSAEDRARLVPHARARDYARGDEIFGEGSPSEQFYVIASGRVKIFKMTPAGKDVILEIFGVGDPLGAVAVYEGWPFPASAVALEDTTCVTIERSAFFRLLDSHPTLVRGLLLGLTHRLVELTNRLAELTGSRVEPRFARLFLKLAGEVGKPATGGTFIALPLSRQELADLSGTTIETAIRIMSRWGKQGIVVTEKGGFLLVDSKALEALAAG